MNYFRYSIKDKININIKASC